MPMHTHAASETTPPDLLRRVLLRRSGLVFIEAAIGPTSTASQNLLRAVDLHLASLGYVMSGRLRDRVASLSDASIEAFRASTFEVLARPVAAGQPHKPLFSKFPDDVTFDTFELWMKRVLVHFCQSEAQPCIHCRQVGTTHVLSPCHHVVCDRCFDGQNYTACPVCNRATDASPFYLPREARELSPKERVRFRLLDVGDDLDAAARDLFTRLCTRPQALSPTDRDDLSALVRGLGMRCIPWIPKNVPVRENRSVILGTLFREVSAATVLPVAHAMLTTATDVLRFLSVFSLRDGSLQAVPRFCPDVKPTDPRWAPSTRKRLDAQDERNRKHARRYRSTHLPLLHQSMSTPRFPIAKLSRPMRRALLGVLEAMPETTRTEDMLRHRSLWVWAGEILHPHDYKRRFSSVARSFDVVRERLPDGTPAPAFVTYNARLSHASARGDAVTFLSLLRERPGELGRRYDHALRLANGDPEAITRTLDALTRVLDKLSMPVLMTLWSVVPTRARAAPVRLYWPKGQLSLGTQAPDTRPPLSADVITRTVHGVEAELLRRFARCGSLGDMVIDRALASVMVPFNERTAGRSAVALPRGSRLAVPGSKALRLFLHWCQPKHGWPTDIDLSVGFYDSQWNYRGVCSYYQLTQQGTQGVVVAQSSGDRTDAPHPDGASEFIDLDRGAARASGFRYAAMIVNAYSGMPFSALERATAGVMLRDDLSGAHFDARTVELAFDLQGDNGVYLPLIVDLETDTLHWVDVYTPGMIQMNNVASSNRQVTRLGPALLAYFGSGVRASMLDLGMLHAAARAARVTVRDPDGSWHRYVRAADEDASHFLALMRTGVADAQMSEPGALRTPTLAVLLRGDVALPEGSRAYALFREQVTSPLSASDLLVTP